MSYAELIIGATTGTLRHIQNMKAGRKQKGWGENITGAIGEMVVAKWLKKYWWGAIGDLSAADVGTHIQVRATEYEHGHLTVHKRDADDQPFILVTGRGPVFCIRGWLFGRDAKQKQWWSELQKGRPAFNVPAEKLNPMSTLVLPEE